MDNPSDDIILPEADVEIHAEPPAPNRRKKTTLLISIAAIVFLALLGTLVFAIVKSTDSKEEVVPDTPSEETFVYDNSSFNDAIDQAEEYIKSGDYLAARESLQQFPVPERMTSAQRYRYYSTLALLYADNAMQDRALYERYTDLAKRNLEAIQKGE
ncbi:hypothetical protein IJG96_00935 [Candidatus Saccharibacteria bacterium]|nr:hypothetical protein [Candidatus Saccharibacteria bacterium]